MAYFRHNEPIDATRRQTPLYTEIPDEEYPEDEDTEYDDGFDALEEEEPDPQEEAFLREERKMRLRDRIRVLMDVSNLAAILIGTAAILLMLTLLFNMINFLASDMRNSFTLFQTRL